MSSSLVESNRRGVASDSRLKVELVRLRNVNGSQISSGPMLEFVCLVSIPAKSKDVINYLSTQL